MSIQYTDGSFSENLPIEKALETFQEAIKAETAKALFIGTEKELKEIKTIVNLQEQLNELSVRIKELETQHRSIIHLPNAEELRQYFRDFNIGDFNIE